VTAKEFRQLLANFASLNDRGRNQILTLLNGNKLQGKFGEIPPQPEVRKFLSDIVYNCSDLSVAATSKVALKLALPCNEPPNAEEMCW
jgi:hypothetical protein